jgi:serine/threonine protein kinase/Flp pilus assembly protein TadD
MVNSLRTSLRTLSADDSQPSDAEFEQLIEQITARLQGGERIDLERLAEEHPAYADQVRDLLPALEMLARIGEAPLTRHATNGDAPHSAQQQLGDYRIIRELGRGGMGVVYEAEQISLGRRVALKVLPFAGMLDQQQLARFKNEARAAATLHHEHIVPIHAVGSERGVHFYAMQLIEGQSLAQVIEQLRARSQCPPLPPGEGRGEGALESEFRIPKSEIATRAVAHLSTIPDVRNREYWQTVARLGIEAAEALDHAHQNGVLHRDIKPANMLVDNAGKLWITDFGLARMETDACMTMTGDIIGTLRYMSPEQVLAKRAVVDHRSDIYSLGAALYELLTLQPAFGETDRAELLKQIAFEEPRPPRQIDQQISVELETIVLKAMRKSPEERYASASELADDLKRFIEHKPIKAKPPTWREQAVKWSRRHPAAIWAGVLVLISMTITSTISAVLITRAYEREAAQRELAETQRQNAEAERGGRKYMVGLSLYNKGELDEAIPAFRDSVKLNPNYAPAHHNLGVALIEKGESDEAIAAFRDALNLNPEYASAHHNLGCALAITGELDEAVVAFREVVKLEPDNSLAYRYVGWAYLQMGRPDEAIANCREALRLSPDTAEFHSMLGYALFYAGRKDEATSEFEKAIADCRNSIRNPANSFMRWKLAAILASCPVTSLRNPLEAVKLATEALELEPPGAHDLATLGIAHYGAGNISRAVEVLQRAYKLDKNNTESLFFLAMAEWQLGNHDAAREWYEKAVTWMDVRPKIAAGDLHRFRSEAEELLGITSSGGDLSKLNDGSHNDDASALRGQIE